MDPRQGNNLDPWYDSYAARTAGLGVSEVRALFAVASRPEVVSLAGGMPFVSALPRELVQGALDRVLTDHGPQAMQYGSGQGLPRLREQILDVMALEGIRASVDDLVVTTGSQHALELVTKLFVDPGDVVLAEAPSYVTALVVFRSFQADVRHVATDELAGERRDEGHAARERDHLGPARDGEQSSDLGGGEAGGARGVAVVPRVEVVALSRVHRSRLVSSTASGPAPVGGQGRESVGGPTRGTPRGRPRGPASASRR